MNLAIKPPHISETDNFYQIDGFIGKGARARKAKRQEAKQERKARKVAAKTERKAARVAGRQDRKAARVENRAVRKQTKVNAKVERRKKAVSELPAPEIDEQTGEEVGGVKMKPEQAIKLKKYLERRGQEVEDDTDPALLAAQFQEERAREIGGRYVKRLQEVDEGEISNDIEWVEENEPDIEDIEEEILEEEENTFSFTGEADNFLDPQTLAVAGAVGQKGLDLLRKKRFAAGKKFFGQTQAQYEAKQKALAQGAPTTLDELTAAGAREGVRQTIARKPTLLIVGVVVIVSAIAGMIYLSKKSK